MEFEEMQNNLYQSIVKVSQIVKETNYKQKMICKKCGNQFIEEEGFNPNTFINCHKFENFEHSFEFISDIYENKEKLIPL